MFVKKIENYMCGGQGWVGWIFK